MKFIFADCLDYIDPKYDFENDECHRGRRPYWDDQFPHEYLGYAPYDGILISRAIVGDHKFSGKYTQSQAMRFRRVGARKFMRFDSPQFQSMPIFGDCGAFQYCKLESPPYTPQDMIEFYEDGGFTFGISIDHIIFDFDQNLKGMDGGSEDAKNRFDITLGLADQFLNECKSQRVSFHPIGVVQGWSPGSMREATRRLIAMGYDYIAIGGLVPLMPPEIHAILQEVTEEINGRDIKIHLLGFAKADSLSDFTKYKIASFDTTSPLIRAFKDDKQNYYELHSDESLEYYTAIRIPQVNENNTLGRKIKTGTFRQEDLTNLEKEALHKIREYDKGVVSLDDALDAIMKYSKPLFNSDKASDKSNDFKLNKYMQFYRRTLLAKPWQKCSCKVCDSISVEAILFRASNRNKRRGIHNLTVFYEHLQKILRKQLCP